MIHKGYVLFRNIGKNRNRKGVTDLVGTNKTTLLIIER